MSQETHAGQWLGFRQPVLRVAREKRGETIDATYEANPGEVWEENEFWIALSLADRSRRRARHPQVLRVARIARASRSRSTSTTAGCSRTRCPGLPEAAAQRGPDAAAVHAQVRRVQGRGQRLQPRARAPLADDELASAVVDGRRDGRAATARRSASSSTASPRAGFTTPSRKLEFYSPTLATWGWPEHAIPRYIAGPRALARSEARRGRVRSAAELPAADADPHALAR